MKLSKTMKKFVAVVCTLALVVSSLAVNNFVKADDGSWAFTSTSYQTNAEKTQYNITVNYSAYQGANPDEYYYSVYVDEEDEAHLGIASNGWNWGKDKGRHLFDTVYKTKDGEAFQPGETHKVIVVAYEKNEDDTYTRLDSIETEITLPAELPTLSSEEQAVKDMEDACVSDANLAKGTTGFVSWSEEAAPALVDGNIGSGTGNSSVKGDDDFVGVNLGEVKTIGSIITKFESACPAEFAVYVAGADGVYGDAPVATNTASGVNPIVKTTFNAVEAQYVKVVQTTPSDLSTAYGMNVFELAVFAGEAKDPVETDPVETDPVETDPVVTDPVETDPVVTDPVVTDPVVDKPAVPAGLTHAPGADGTLPFHFAWAPVEGATSYNVYLNDAFVATVITTDYNFEETLFAEAGDYTIAVTAVKDDVESDKATVTYTVQGTEPGTTDPNETSEADTTEAPVAEIVMDQTFNTDGNHELGGYTVYVGNSWNASAAIAGVDANDKNHVKVQQTSSNWGQAWGLQVVKKFAGFEANTEYTVEWPIVSASTDGKVKLTGDPEVELTGGEQTLTGKFTTDENGNGEFVVGMGWVGLANPIEFFAPVVKDADGNVVTPKDPEETTTPATEETTTPAAEETTTPATDETTTPATEETTPSVDETTTEAPTTTAPKATTTKKALGKTKVKKATKKKAAKKVKITFKKVKGAKKYKVQISTTKKFKKVLVKKTVKKVKVTISSKKLKNKKKLYVRVRAVGAKKWSKAKKIKIKK